MSPAEPLPILKALADESRLRIMASLLSGPRYVEELAERLNLSASTISHHLKKLEGADLVDPHKLQYYTEYRARTEMLDSTLQALVLQAGDPPDAEKQRHDRYRRKVLSTFFEGSRLIQMPAQFKKRLMVLEAMALDFTLHQKYPEVEVNAIITRRYEDYCLIRREMVMTKIMERDGGIYCRTMPLGDEGHQVLPAPDETPPDPREQRKALIRQHKQAAKQAGIYWVKNLETGRVLLGSSLNLHGPLNRHQAELRFGSHRCQALQADWDTLGQEKFAFEVVATVPAGAPTKLRESALKKLEQRWIGELQPFQERCYNTSERIRTRPF